jgi:hypothetical protein
MCQYIHLLLEKVAQKEDWKTKEEFPKELEFEDTLAAHSLRKAYEQEYEIVEEQNLEGYEDIPEDIIEDDEIFYLRGSQEKKYERMLPDSREVLERASVTADEVSREDILKKERPSIKLEMKKKKKTPNITKNLSRAVRELGLDEDMIVPAYPLEQEES